MASLRAALFGGSNIAQTLGFWFQQLDEFAHKAIARRDTIATKAIVSAMAKIGAEYMDARKSSVILRADISAMFLVPTSDINDVLSKIHESIQIICDDAIEHKNELVATHCIATLGNMACKAMTVVHQADGMRKSVPLAYQAIFYLKLCIEAASKAKIETAILTAINALRAIINSTKPDVDTTTEFETVLETLFSVAIAGYREPSSVVVKPAVELLMLAAKLDLEQRGYKTPSAFDTALKYVEALVPFEIVMDIAKQRFTQTFPPYAMSSEANVANLLQQVLNRTPPLDAERSWLNPFNEFCKVSGRLSQHYRELGKNDFKNALLRKWIADTVFECAGLHIWILNNAEVDMERFLPDVEKKLEWMLHASAFLFPAQAPFGERHASETAGSLAYIGISCLKTGRLKLADECASIISNIARNCSTASRDTYAFADIVEKIEAMSLAAEMLKMPGQAARYRALLSKPAAIPTEDIVHYLNSITTRIGQMRNEIEHFRGATGRRDPTQLLHQILGTGDLPENEDYLKILEQWS